MIKKFFGFIGKLFQGAGRIVLTVLLLVAAILVGYLILEPIFIKSALSSTSQLSSGTLFAPVFIFVFCVIAQIAWDVLDIGILDNLVGRIIKRVIFYLGLALLTIMTFVFYYTEVALPNSDLYDLGFIGKGIVVSFVFAPAVCGALYTYFIVSDADKSIAPFIPLYSWGGCLVLGLVVGILFEVSFVVTFLPIIALVASIGFMIFYMKKTDTFIFSDASYSYSGGGSSSGSSYSPSYYNDDDDDTPTDKRGTDLFGDLKGDFYKIASNHSTSHSIGYGATVLFDIDMSTYGNSVVFTVNGRLYNADSFSSQYEVDKAQENLQSATKTVMQRVYNDAERAIKSAQDKYTDYEHYQLSVEPGNIY